MNASQLKLAALCWFRFKKRCQYIATEVGMYSADVAATNEKYLYEVEVKISERDFRADFIKPKHKFYHAPIQPAGLWVPNKFYFMVPSNMVDFALRELEKHPDYGLLTVNWKAWEHDPGEVITVKQAKFLHRDPPHPKHVVNRMLLRMSSEICGFHLKKEAENNKQDFMNRVVDNLTKEKKSGKKNKKRKAG